MLSIRSLILIALVSPWVNIQATEIKKWTDQDGKVHYGDIARYTRKVEILELNDSVPEITEGEKLMRMKNDLYFQKLELKRQQQRLAKVRAAVKKQQKKFNQAEKQQRKLDSDRRACIKAKLKIEDIKDDMREGYSTSTGIKLEKKLRQQKRRVEAYC